MTLSVGSQVKFSSCVKYNKDFTCKICKDCAAGAFKLVDNLGFVHGTIKEMHDDDRECIIYIRDKDTKKFQKEVYIPYDLIIFNDKPDPLFNAIF